MCIETCQILSTILILNGQTAHMKKTHENHPCAVWAGETKENFEWLLAHGLELFAEYTFRYGKIHASEFKLKYIQEQKFRPNSSVLTPFAQAFKKYPELVSDNAVNSYRAYYIFDKVRIAKWNKTRNPPSWWLEHFEKSKNIIV